jgi:hypothetical protein
MSRLLHDTDCSATNSPPGPCVCRPQRNVKDGGPVVKPEIDTIPSGATD